jgi:hypothetical protein
MQQIKKAIKRSQWRFYTKINARLEVEARFVMKGIENMLAVQKRKGFSRRKETIETIIDQDHYLNGKKFDLALEKLDSTPTHESALLGEVKKNCVTAITHLKSTDRDKRFFSLETINFYKSKLAIEKFVEILWLSKKPEALKFAAVRLIHHFIEFCNAIDDFNQTHVEKGELVLIRHFRDELGRRLYSIISKQSQEYLQNKHQKGSEHCVQLLREAVFDESEGRLKNMLRNEGEEIIEAIADYLVFLQSDKLLPILGKARYKYYISFLGNMVDAKQAPLNKIIAGCLLQNRQYSPPTEIVQILETNDITEQTLRSITAYLFNLTPSTLDKTIQRIGSIFETIEGNMGKPDYLKNIHYLSEEMSVPRHIEKIFLDAVRTGLLDLNVGAIRELHETISGVNVRYNQKKGDVIKDLFIPANIITDKKVDQIESVEDLLLITESDLSSIVGSFMSLFGPESILIFMLQKVPQELKKKIISSLSPVSAKMVYTRLSMCLNCRYLNEHMIFEKDQFKETLETLFLSGEDPLFCGYKYRGSANSSCFHEPSISGYQKAFFKQANQYLNDFGINVTMMIS